MKNTIAALGAATTLLAASATMAGQLGPARLVDALRNQPDNTYDFVVTFAPGGPVDEALLQRPDARALPIIGAVALRITVKEALALAEGPDVEWVWYFHPDEALGNIRIIEAMGATVAASSNFANLSIGPPSSFFVQVPDYDSPVIRALQAAAADGVIPVVAIGNEGVRAPGYVNPWSIPPWVISVGAWDHTTDAVWAASSTALPEQIEAWPDVVAPGVDVISAWPTNLEKTAAQKARDEGDARFRATVPEAEWDLYTMMSGTSQATAMVTNAAATVFGFVRDLAQQQNSDYGDPMFSLEVGPDRISEHDRVVQRLTGTAEPTANGGMVYTYVFDEPWKLVKQILMDTAIPVPGAEPWQAGAGLVLPDHIRQQFPTAQPDPVKILPLKVK